MMPRTKVLGPPPSKMAMRNVRAIVDGDASPPQVLKAPWCQLGVADCRLNAAMTKVGLQCSCVRSLIRQGKASIKNKKRTHRQKRPPVCPRTQL